MALLFDADEVQKQQQKVLVYCMSGVTRLVEIKSRQSMVFFVNHGGLFSRAKVDSS
jgi:hypothetical protein